MRDRFGPKVMVVLRLGPRRRARGADVYADRHRQAQRRRPAGLARRCARPDRGDAADPARRTPFLELGPRYRAPPPARGLIRALRHNPRADRNLRGNTALHPRRLPGVRLDPRHVHPARVA